VSPLRRPHKDTGLRLFARTVAGRAYPRIIGQLRDKRSVLLDVGLPLVAVSAYVFVYRALGAPEEFVGFVLVGGAMTAFWLNVLWAMANQFFWEKESGNLALYILSPASMAGILLGMALGGMLATTVRAIVILAAGSWMFDVRFEVSDPLMVAMIFLLALVALYGMGMMFSSLFLLVGREGWHLIGLAQEPVYLAAGMYFPVRSLPLWVGIGASAIPLTLALDAIRQLAFVSGGMPGLLSVRTEALILAALAVVYLTLAYLSLAYMERLAVAEGKLTESRA
jgi:ABC-2 type transport system permease protein